MSKNSLIKHVWRNDKTGGGLVVRCVRCRLVYSITMMENKDYCNGPARKPLKRTDKQW